MVPGTSLHCGNSDTAEKTGKYQSGDVNSKGPIYQGVYLRHRLGSNLEGRGTVPVLFSRCRLRANSTKIIKGTCKKKKYIPGSTLKILSD